MAELSSRPFTSSSPQTREAAPQPEPGSQSDAGPCSALPTPHPSPDAHSCPGSESDFTGGPCPRRSHTHHFQGFRALSASKVLLKSGLRPRCCKDEDVAVDDDKQGQEEHEAEEQHGVGADRWREAHVVPGAGGSHSPLTPAKEGRKTPGQGVEPDAQQDERRPPFGHHPDGQRARDHQMRTPRLPLAIWLPPDHNTQPAAQQDSSRPAGLRHCVDSAGKHSSALQARRVAHRDASPTGTSARRPWSQGSASLPAWLGHSACE